MKAKASGGWRLDTSCIHAGEGIDTDTRAIRRPIHMANSYELPTDVERLLEVFSWDHLDKFQYSREHSATPRHLEERLAACCQIVGPITSVYRWQDGIERTQEWMCQIKTEDSLYDAVEIAIRQQHHYDEPEIIATQIVRGSAGYLKWLSENVSS